MDQVLGDVSGWEMLLYTNNRRKLLIGGVVLLVVAPLLFLGAYLIRQNYVKRNHKSHHYTTITGTRQFGLHRGEKYRFTGEQQEEMDRQVEILNQKSIDERKKYVMERSRSHN